MNIQKILNQRWRADSFQKTLTTEEEEEVGSRTEASQEEGARVLPSHPPQGQEVAVKPKVMSKNQMTKAKKKKEKEEAEAKEKLREKDAEIREMEEQMERERDKVRKREKEAAEAERIALVEIAKAKEVAKKALEMRKEIMGNGKDVLMETTGKALLNTLFDVDFRKNDLINKVEGNARNHWQFGDDPCKPRKNCESCVPRSKLSGDLGAKIEHLELQKKMRVDEIRVLDRELSVKKEEKRRFDQTKCSLEEEENEPKRRKVSNEKFTIPKLSSQTHAGQDRREEGRGDSRRAEDGRRITSIDSDTQGVCVVRPGGIKQFQEEESGRPLPEVATEGRNESSGWEN